MEEDLKVLEEFLNGKQTGYLTTKLEDNLIKVQEFTFDSNKPTDKVAQAIENLIKGYKELEEYQHKVNEILNLDDDNLDIVLVDNCQKGLKKCVTEFEKENQSYRDYKEINRYE